MPCGAALADVPESASTSKGFRATAPQSCHQDRDGRIREGKRITGFEEALDEWHADGGRSQPSCLWRYAVTPLRLGDP